MKTLRVFLTAIFCCSIWHASAQVYSGIKAEALIPLSKEVRINSLYQSPSFIQIKDEVKKISSQPASLLNEVLNLKSEDKFTFIKSETDKIGIVHQKFQQSYKGYPVENAVYNVHIKNGKTETLNGTFIPNLNVETKASISEQQALNFALNGFGGKKFKWENPNAEKLLKEVNNDNKATYYPKGTLTIVEEPLSKQFRLCYKFDIYSEIPLKRAYVFIDAVTGKKIQEINRIQTNDVLGTANTKYSGTQTITTDSVAVNSFRLREIGRGSGIETYNMATGSDYASAVDFTDNNNIWNNVNANKDEVATDAHLGAEKTYDYYFTTFGRNSIDNAGLKLVSFVHYDFGYNNAYWDGTAMTYGDGDGSMFTPLTCLDVAGHEITHGLTQFTANLIYSGESGALNEGFSDIFGTVIEAYTRPGNHDWVLGAEITPGGQGIRSMSNPKIHQNPDTYEGTYWYPEGDVHTNSSILNHWFYLLTDGGSGTNDKGNSYNVGGIGMDKAAAIAFRTLTVYLTPSSNYDDARFYSIKSAEDLYGTCSAEVIATANAWYAVGVGSIPNFSVLADFSVNSIFSCSLSNPFSFTNKSSNANSFIWDFGDGTTSTLENPTHTYSSVGTYSVSLIVSGSGACTSGGDTTIKANLIQVTNGGGPKPALCQPTTQNYCCGIGITHFKLGSINNTTNDASDGYQDYSCGASTTLIAGENYPVSFTVSSYNEYVKCWIDYNNDGAFDSTEVCFSGSGLDSITGMLNASNAQFNIPLRMRIASDYNPLNSSCSDLSYGQAEDYTVIINENTNPPVADFIASSVNIGVGQQVNFTDLSTKVPTSWTWLFPGGTPSTSNLKNPVVVYNSNGSFDVTLIVSNSFGTDTIIKSSYINVSNSFNMCGASSSVSPNGILFDSGGPGGMYNDGENCSFLIDPGCASSITLTFQNVSMESCCDHLSVYDGKDASAPLLLSVSGYSIPSPLTASSGSLFLRFQSDGSVTDNGFEATWNSVVYSSNPIANFGMSENNPPVGINIQFSDSSLNEPKLWNWNFGDGVTSTSQNPVHKYNLPGNYPVSLIISRCDVSDTIIKNINVLPAGSIEVNPDSLRITIMSGDSANVPLQIINNGIGELRYATSLSNAFDSTSQKNFYTTGDSTQHTFTGLGVSDSLWVDVTINGDYDDSFYEYCDLYIDGDYKGRMPNGVSNGTDISKSYLFVGDSVRTWLNNGSLSITLKNSIEVNNNLGGLDKHTVRVRVKGIDWLQVNSKGKINAGDTVTANVKFNARSKNAGLYTYYFNVESNDLTKPAIKVPCIMNVIGAPSISLTHNNINFGNVIVGLSKNDTIKIKNLGSDTLRINSISINNSAFTYSLQNNKIAPAGESRLVVVFSPGSINSFSANLNVLNNDRDTIIPLIGNGTAAPVINANPLAFNVTLWSGDSTSRNLTISNTGPGDLEYNIKKPRKIEVLALTYGADMIQSYPNTINAISTYFTDYNLTAVNTTLSTILASSLTGKDVLLIPDLPSANSSVFSSFAGVLQSFVNNGGKVIFCGTSNYYVIYNSGLLAPINYNYLSGSNLAILNPSHPLAKNLPSSYMADYTCLGMTFSTSLPVTSIVNGSSYDVLSYRTMGLGAVIYVGFNFSQNNSYSSNVIANAVKWRSDLIPDWLAASYLKDTLATSSSAITPIKFNARNLSRGTYNYDLKVISNDPGSPELAIPCTLTVKQLPKVKFGVSTFASCNGQVSFKDSTSNNPSSWKWNFGDGFSSTSQNPTHFYTNNGFYNVSLIACNADGCDTLLKNNLIEIKIGSQDCDTLTIPGSGTGTLQTNCYGKIYDSGGNQNCKTNVNGSVTIAPTGSTRVTLTFQSFNYESCCDGLYIYDGPNTSSPLIGHFTGSALPGGGTISSTGSSITLQEVTDGSVNYSGFEASWQCTPNNQPPVVKFNSEKINVCSNNVAFLDSTTNFPSSWVWTFGDGTISTQRNVVHTYLSNGNYLAKLKVCNSNGCDSMSKQILIDLPSAAFSCSDSGYTGIPVNFSINNTVNYYSLWDFGNGYLSNLNNPKYAYPLAGSYTVILEVTDTIGCRDTVSRRVIISDKPTVGIKSANKSAIQVYPNPSDGLVHVVLPIEGTQMINTEVINVLGEIVKRYSDKASGIFNKDLNFFDVPKGIYYIRISSKDEIITRKITIQ